MKITVERQALTESFLLASSVAPTRSPKEVLTNVKIVATEDSLVITATDCEVGLATTLTDGLIVKRPGAVLLPVVKVSGILRESRSELIEIETDENGGVQLSGTGTKYRLPSVDPAEFPSVNGFGDGDFASLPSQSLLKGIARTGYATDSESSRYALAGVKVEEEDGGLVFIGTDGRRMATQHTEAVMGNCKFHGSIIVPTKAIAAIQKTLSKSHGDCKIRASVNEIHVEADSTCISARLVEGRYPEWRRVTPPDLDDFQRVEIAASLMLQTVRQASIMTDIDSRGVEMKFSRGSLMIQASASELGDSKVEVPIEYDGEVITLVVDFRFVLDVCKSVHPEQTLLVRVNSKTTPMVLSTDDGHQSVLMPMAR